MNCFKKHENTFIFTPIYRLDTEMTHAVTVEMRPCGKHNFVYLYFQIMAAGGLGITMTS